MRSLPGQDAHAEPVELSARDALSRLYRCLTESLIALSEERPLLLVLDDLQWADELTLGWLEELARAGAAGALARTRLLVVGTYRSEEVPVHGDAGDRTALQRLLQVPGLDQIGLGRLEEPAVATIVSDMLAMTPPPQHFVRFLSRQSEGNPFFVAEYLRAAVEQSILFRDEAGRWQIELDGTEAAESLYEELPLPRSLRELVGRRLDTLSMEARTLVEPISVIGREIPEALLGRIVGTVGTPQGLEVIRELVARCILEEPGGGRLRFVHDRLREGVYERIDLDRRRVLHRVAAECFEALGAAEGGAGVEDAMNQASLGRHWEQADEPARAQECYLSAARKAGAQYAHAEAERLYTAWLRLAAGPSLQTVAVRNELAQSVLFIQGRNQESMSEHSRALDEARLLGDRTGEGVSLLKLADRSQKLGRYEESYALCGQALDLLREAGLRAAEGEALTLQATLHYEQGQFDAAAEITRQALVVVREIRDRKGEGVSLLLLGNLHRATGRLDQARVCYEQSMDISRQLRNRRSEAIALGNLALLDWDQGRLEEARSRYEQVLRMAREMGDRETEARNLGNLALTWTSQGRLDEAEVSYKLALDVYRQIGARRTEAYMLVGLAAVLFERGRSQDAQQLVEQALARHREFHDRNGEAMALGDLAEIHAYRGQFEEARLFCEQALATHRKTQNRYYEAMVLSGLAEIHLLQGRLEEATPLCEQALATHRELDNRRYLAITLRIRTQLERRAGGDLGQAERWIREAESILESPLAPVHLAMILCELGHIALATGQSARTLIERAYAMMRQAGTEREGPNGRALDALQRAQEAFESGRPLFRGECFEDLPEALRRQGKTGRERRSP